MDALFLKIFLLNNKFKKHKIISGNGFKLLEAVSKEMTLQLGKIKIGLGLIKWDFSYLMEDAIL